MTSPLPAKYGLCAFLSTVLAASLLTAQLRPEISARAAQLGPLSVTTQPYTQQGIHLKDSTALLLQEQATTAELLAMTAHPKPEARMAALFALLNRPERDSLGLERLVPAHFRDTATLKLEAWGEHRTHLSTQVGEAFLQTIGSYTNNLFWLNDGFELDTTAQAWLDSVFLCSNTRFNGLKNTLLWQWAPTEQMYPCIRRLLASGQDNHLSSFLAKYQRPEDINLITAHLPKADRRSNSHPWQPFWHFMHPEMFAFLASKLEQEWKDGMYLRVLAKYQNQEAAALLDSVFQRIDTLGNARKQQYLAVHLSRALGAHYDTIYAPLYLKILTQYPENANFRIPEALWATYPDTLYRLSLVWKNGGRAERERAMRMMPKVIEYLQRTQPDTLYAEIISRIKLGFDQSYYAEHPADLGATMKAFKYIYRSRAPYFIEPLFGFLEEEPLAKNRFFIAKLLLHFDEPDIEDRLTRFFQMHSELAPTLKDAEQGGKFYSNFIYHAQKE